DPGKDQSYFLHAVDRSALDDVTFPLGEAHKDWVREQARAAGLPNSDRPDSTGICFIGERRFDDFLATYLDVEPGPMITPEGAQVGQHRGLIHYTIGQRHGLGIGGGRGQPGKPWYVLAKDTRDNRLVVGQGSDHPWLFARGVVTEAPHWLIDPPAPPLRAQAQVRYRQQPVPCHVDPANEHLMVNFDEPVRAATPGQSLVLYDDALCLGGAIIARPVPDRAAEAPIEVSAAP
ncbi:MAG: tRNA 2-thiouridine(34) synthase MnmA, partial [Proteobacteria bacterium SW_6_67_9]